MKPFIVVTPVGPNPPAGICEMWWGPKECPNPAEWLVVNNANLGFAVMCGPHCDGFQIECPIELGGYHLEPYTAKRALELYQMAKGAGL